MLNDFYTPINYSFQVPEAKTQDYAERMFLGIKSFAQSHLRVFCIIFIRQAQALMRTNYEETKAQLALLQSKVKVSYFAL